MKVLVTGSAGFIAGYLVEELLNHNYKVVGIDNFSKYGETQKSYDDHPRYEFVQGDVKDTEFLKELIERHGGTDDRVAIITHGGFIYMLQHVIFKFEEGEFTLTDDVAHTWLRTNNTSVSRIDFGKNRLIQTYMNRVDHLPTEIIT